MSPGLQFRLLGPLEVRNDAHVVPLGGVRQRSVLALLLLARGEVVSADRLVDQLWGESPPAAAATALQGYVSQLRKVLEPERRAGADPQTIVTRAPGYVLPLESDQLDLERFERFAAEGRRNLIDGDAESAAEGLRAALDLWRGPALADLEGERFARDHLLRLEELRLGTLEDRIAADLALGRHHELVPELEDLVRRHPLRERLHEQLMLALYRCGRQADALAVYAALRRALVEELGIEPTPALREVHQSILEQDPGLDAPPRIDSRERSVESAARRFPPRHGWIALVGLGAAVAVVALVLAGRSSHRSNVPVAPNSVARIDARSNRVAADVPVGLTPTSVSFGEGAVWVLNADDQTLTRVDPDTGRAVTFGSGGVPTDVAAGAGGVWVGNGRRSRAQFVGPIASTVSRIDPRTRAVYSTVSLARTGGSISNRNENHIVVGAGAVWVVGPDGSVFRVDPRSATIAATVRSISADAIAAGPDEVWALEQGGMLARIGTRTNRVEQRVPIAATGLDSLAVGFGSVWAVDPYDGTLWRVDARRRPVERTIPVGVGASDVAVGSGAVWVANALRGTVSRIDPRSNRVVATIDVGNTPRHLAVGGGSVWVTVAGAPASSTPASGTLAGGSALPATSCGRVIYGGPGHPDRLIVSDMPLRGGSRLATTQLAAAIEYELRARGFRAGRFHVGYQSCDDSTAQTGIFDSQKCAANAHLFAANRAVIGEVGPFNSGCALAQIPVLGRAPEGPVAMVSPTNSDVTLTRDGPISPRGGLQGLYPSGRRNYVRVFPAEDMQAAANAVLARRLGARRVAVVSDGGYGEAELAYFPRAARQLGLRIVLTKRWNPRARDYGGLVELIAARHPDAVLLSGLLDSNGGELLRAVRRRLPKATVLATDGFLPISGLFRAARSSARGVYVTLAGLAPPTLGPEGRHFVRDFGATHPGQDVDPAAPYAAQAADVLLDAIGRSDGSRRSATRELLATHVRQGILGDLEFDANGDTTSNPVTVLRAVRGGGSSRVGSYDGADIVSVIRPPARLVR